MGQTSPPAHLFVHHNPNGNLGQVYLHQELAYEVGAMNECAVGIDVSKAKLDVCVARGSKIKTKVIRR